MDVRAAGASDATSIDAVITSAFQDPSRPGHGRQVADLWAEVVARGLDRASLVAVEDEQVLGHVGVSHAWLDARERLVDVLVLSPLSVAPERHRSGIGSALVTAAIEAARLADAPALFLEGSPAYYGARGFARASQLGFEAPTRRIPDAAFQVVLFAGHEPWMTGRLVYREVWWQFDATGLRDPDLAVLEKRFAVSP